VTRGLRRDRSRHNLNNNRLSSSIHNGPIVFGTGKQAVLAHELLFGGFLLLMWLRLTWAQGMTGVDSLGFFALLAVGLGLTLYAMYRNTAPAWRARLAFYPVATGIAYLLMRDAVPAVEPFIHDAILQGIDSRLIGANLSLLLEPFTHPVLTEVMSLCYALFIPYVVVSAIRYLRRDLEPAKTFYSGLFSVYGLGFLGYSVLPAVGPYIAMADRFSAPLTGWWITEFNRNIVVTRSILVDVFPSLHCAVSAYILLFDRRHDPIWFKVCLVPCIGLWLSTIYLRYHYFTDVAAGFLLAAVGLWIARRRDVRNGSLYATP
jgi:membrane-associated phospholipid phosphatase